MKLERSFDGRDVPVKVTPPWRTRSLQLLQLQESHVQKGTEQLAGIPRKFRWG